MLVKLRTMLRSILLKPYKMNISPSARISLGAKLYRTNPQGICIGDGSVVTKDVPSGCIVAGSLAKIIKENIMTSQYGKIIFSSVEKE